MCVASDATDGLIVNALQSGLEQMKEARFDISSLVL
jgi:hypothetical protein